MVVATIRQKNTSTPATRKTTAQRQAYLQNTYKLTAHRLPKQAAHSILPVCNDAVLCLAKETSSQRARTQALTTFNVDPDSYTVVVRGVADLYP